VSPLGCTTAWRKALLVLDGGLTAVGRVSCPALAVQRKRHPGLVLPTREPTGPIPLAARGLPAVLARVGPEGAVLGGRLKRRGLRGCAAASTAWWLVSREP